VSITRYKVSYVDLGDEGRSYTLKAREFRSLRAVVTFVDEVLQNERLEFRGVEVWVKRMLTIDETDFIATLTGLKLTPGGSTSSSQN